MRTASYVVSMSTCGVPVVIRISMGFAWRKMRFSRVLVVSDSNIAKSRSASAPWGAVPVARSMREPFAPSWVGAGVMACDGRP